MPAERIPCKPRKEYEKLWGLYKKHLSCFWTAQEVDLSSDLDDWALRLTSEERTFLTHIVGFFAASDRLVLEHVKRNVLQEVSIPEVRAFYGFHSAIETIHSEMYSRLIQTYVLDPDERHDVFYTLEAMPAVRKQADWAARWLASSLPFEQRLCAFACMQGIMCSGSFCAISWINNRGLLKGLSRANEFVGRDKRLHCDFACALYALLGSSVQEAIVQEIVLSAVEAEEAFVCEALSYDLVGLGAKNMRSYVRFVADRLLAALGHSKLFWGETPLDWVEMLSTQKEQSFFEDPLLESQTPLGHGNPFKFTDDY
jgi:ribonucleotide reductase beta subunit family protein with ferritin-like domain